MSDDLYDKADARVEWDALSPDEQHRFMEDLAHVLERGISYPDNWLDVHAWFGLSYSSYLCVNRSLLQSMPDEWQYRFYKLMEELADYFPLIREPSYTVYARDHQGRFRSDPIPHYNRGRTLITPADDYGNWDR